MVKYISKIKMIEAGLAIMSVLLFNSMSAGDTPTIISYSDTVTTGPFQLNRSSFESDLRNLPIGVFDSGVGGLTVLDAIIKLDKFDNNTGEPGSDGIEDFRDERFIYLGDQANMPYGNYSAEGKTEFLRELVVKDVLFLLGNRYWPTRDANKPSYDKPPVKAIVIACNTATAYGYDIVKQALGKWQIPVYLVGVVNAGARGAYSSTGGEGAVAVMATVGTCNSEGYIRAISSTWENEYKIVPPMIQQGCLGLAGAIEGDLSYIGSAKRDYDTYRGPSYENSDATIDSTLLDDYAFEQDGIISLGDSILMLNSVDNYIRYHVLSLIRNFSATGADKPISGVILGCTHFPFYTEQLESAFLRLREYTSERDGEKIKPYSNYISNNIEFIDPAVNTATELYINLRNNSLLIKKENAAVIPTDEFYISVPNDPMVLKHLNDEKKFSYNYKYGRNTGELQIEYVRRVPMTASSLGAVSQDMIKEKLPEIWEMLLRFNSESPRLSETTGENLLK